MPLLLRRSLSWLFLLSLGVSSAADVPKGVILVPGAAAASSDSTTPVPEAGRVVEGRYRNSYFGLAYPIPANWSEQPAGPPPSDGGSYVLTQFALVDPAQKRVKANVLVTAQDLFFSALPIANARELVAGLRKRLSPDFEVEREPGEVKLGDRTFARFGYRASLAGLHWRVLSTESRCHVLTFTFTGTDTAALDAAERAMGSIALPVDGGDTPQCIAGYADGAALLERADPLLTTRRFNSIPVRIIVDREGRVKHIHLLSAFPDQSEAIIAALRQWRFKPYLRDGQPAEVETGIVLGVPRTIMRLPGK
jgi:hypothetical protein